jgi:hypothetical protein
MTFEELSDELPNGFHDARIKNINLNFKDQAISIELDLWVADLEDVDPDRMRSGTLKVLSPYLFLIDPPDPGHVLMPEHGTLWTDGDPVKPGQNSELDKFRPQLPANACVYRFFVDEWNSFMYFAAAGVEFSWDDEPAKQ